MKKLLQKLQEMLENSDSSAESSINIDHAAAVLMVEVMAADDEFGDVEADTIKQLLVDHFQMTESEAQQLLAESQQSHHEAHDLYDYTNVVNKHYKPAQKFELLKSLWKVAYADGSLDRYEEHMIRKLAELLHMPHTQFIKAKLEVLG